MDTATEPRLNFQRYRLGFTGDGAPVSQYWHGFLWRGSLGNRLRALACPLGDTSCKGCMMEARCAYHYIFETPPPADARKMRRYPAVPHPFVLNPGGNLDPASPYTLELVLVGKANTHLPLLLNALEQAGKRGLRGGLGRKQLDSVDRWNPETHAWEALSSLPGETAPMPVPPAPSGGILIQLQSPLRLKHPGGKGQAQPSIRPHELRFEHLFKPLLRRLSALQYFHCGTELQVDFAALGQMAATVIPQHANLHWTEAKRYSSRQQRSVPMGGIVGSLQLDSAGLSPFWPCLWLGQWLNVGKGASMGMGNYRLLHAGEIQ